jgi:hypothetical protein
MTTIGYGEISPYTTQERIVSIIFLFFASVEFGYIMGNLQTAIVK